MKKAILILTLVLGWMFTATAQQNNGTYSFLRATNSARVAALGGLPLPVDDSDIQLCTFNPAAIDSTMSNKLSLSYVDYYTDINFASVQYARTFNKIGSFAGTVQYHNYGNFQETSEGGIVQGDFSCSDFSINLGWGRRLTPHWSIGAALKYAGLQYETYAAGAIAVDVAGTYRTDNKWIFSLNMRNLGVQLFNNFDYRFSPLPFSVDLGASHKLEHLPVTVMFWYDDIQRWYKAYEDGEKANFVKNLASHFVVGGELNIGKNLVLRSAFNYGQRFMMNVPEARTLVGFSAGVAVKIKMFEISYARSRDNITLSPNYLTITMDLNKF